MLLSCLPSILSQWVDKLHRIQWIRIQIPPSPQPYRVLRDITPLLRVITAVPVKPRLPAIILPRYTNKLLKVYLTLFIKRVSPLVILRALCQHTVHADYRQRQITSPQPLSTHILLNPLFTNHLIIDSTSSLLNTFKLITIIAPLFPLISSRTGGRKRSVYLYIPTLCFTLTISAKSMHFAPENKSL